VGVLIDYDWANRKNETGISNLVDRILHNSFKFPVVGGQLQNGDVYVGGVGNKLASRVLQGL
jgi:hypothetical protein